MPCRWRRGSVPARCTSIASTGSLEPGKRADLIVVDLDRLHNVPAFDRDPNGIYARIVYAAKSTDVVDVMCNGAWLMRDRALLTLDERALREAAQLEARRVDRFLASREVSVLQKLVAVGGAIEQESFEVQVKARLASETPVLAVLSSKPGHGRAIEPLPPVRHLLVVRRSGSRLAALPRGRIPRRRGQGDRRAGALTLTGRTREGDSARCCCSARAISRPRPIRRASIASTSAGSGACRRKRTAPLAARLSRRRVLPAPRPPDHRRPTATSSRLNRGPGRGATPRTRRPSSTSSSRCSAPIPTTPSATATSSSPPAAPDNGRSSWRKAQVRRSLSPLHFCEVQIPPAVDDREMGRQLVGVVTRLHGLLQPLDANG